MIKTAGLDVLNCGMGHLEIRFNEQDVIELERAKRIIGDMLKRGYSFFVHGKDDALTRVKRFDAKKGVYIIAYGPTVEATPLNSTLPSGADVRGILKGKRGRPRKGETSIPMATAKATVVGRSAGG